MKIRSNIWALCLGLLLCGSLLFAPSPACVSPVEQARCASPACLTCPSGIPALGLARWGAPSSFRLRKGSVSALRPECLSLCGGDRWRCCVGVSPTRFGENPRTPEMPEFWDYSPCTRPCTTGKYIYLLPLPVPTVGKNTVHTHSARLPRLRSERTRFAHMEG